MNLEGLFNTIESLEFEANLMISSGSILFNKLLKKDETTQELVKMLREDEHCHQAVFERLQYLLNLPTQKGYFHEHDIAIATYIWVLSKVNDELTLMATKRVLEHPQMHWGRIIAKGIRNEIVHSGLHVGLNPVNSDTLNNSIVYLVSGQMSMIEDTSTSQTIYARTSSSFNPTTKVVIQIPRKEAS